MGLIRRVIFPFSRKKKKPSDVESVPREKGPLFTERFRSPVWKYAFPIAKEILFEPEVFWKNRKLLPSARSREILYDFALPLALVGSAVWYIGSLFFDDLGEYPVIAGLRDSVYRIGISIVTVYLAAMFLVYVIERRASAVLSLDRAVMVIAYAATPWLLFRSFPWLPLLGEMPRLISFYGVFLLFLGLKEILGGQEFKDILFYTAASSGVFLLSSFIF